MCVTASEGYVQPFGLHPTFPRSAVCILSFMHTHRGSVERGDVANALMNGASPQIIARAAAGGPPRRPRDTLNLQVIHRDALYVVE